MSTVMKNLVHYSLFYEWQYCSAIFRFKLKILRKYFMSKGKEIEKHLDQIYSELLFDKKDKNSQKA
jgi:hypothetical protein